MIPQLLHTKGHQITLLLGAILNSKTTKITTKSTQVWTNTEFSELQKDIAYSTRVGARRQSFTWLDLSVECPILWLQLFCHSVHAYICGCLQKHWFGGNKYILVARQFTNPESVNRKGQQYFTVLLMCAKCLE